MSTKQTTKVSNSILFQEVAEMVASGHRVEIVGKGSSMFPMIRGKDKIVLRKVDNLSIERGNILLVKLENGNYVLHRVKKHDTRTLILQGDGNLRNVETCKAEDVIAETVEVIRGKKRIAKGSCSWKMYSRLSRQPFWVRRVVLAVWRRVSPV